MKKATFDEILKYILRGELDDDGFVGDIIADHSMNTFREFLETIDDLNEVNSVKNRSGKMIQMDPTLRHILHQWLNNNSIVHEHLNSKGITTLGQFKHLISNPNMVNLIKDKTGASISDELKERLSEVLSYMNQLQMLHGPISKVGVYDFRLKSGGDFPWMKLDEALPHDDYKDNISSPNLASDCSNNQFPTAETSTFSTTTTNRNFAFIDARSNYDNMNYLLFSYASNITAVPRLTVAKQTFEAQSKLFDRGIPSVVSPASLMAAKHFFDEQSKLFDRGNPSTDLISTGLSEARLVWFMKRLSASSTVVADKFNFGFASIWKVIPICVKI